MSLSWAVPPSKRITETGFSEVGAWEAVGSGWRQLSGSFWELGYSIEGHDFEVQHDLDWTRSFHPAGLEICLNIAGHAQVQVDGSSLELGSCSAGFYAQRKSGLKGLRRGGERHQFFTIELSLPSLKSIASSRVGGLHPRVAPLLADNPRLNAVVSEPVRLSSEQQQVALSLGRPPVYQAAQWLWYQAKALEIAATILYQPSPVEELFCQRVKRINRERVQKVTEILKESLADPPPLEEIGRRVGCSHFHLSRIFTQEMGKPMIAYLKELRLERAAELLRTGQCNVTEAALEVGYNSLSHFTVAFRSAFGCCPGLYPLRRQRTPVKVGVSPG